MPSTSPFPAWTRVLSGVARPFVTACSVDVLSTVTASIMPAKQASHSHKLELHELWQGKRTEL